MTSETDTRDREKTLVKNFVADTHALSSDPRNNN